MGALSRLTQAFVFVALPLLLSIPAFSQSRSRSSVLDELQHHYDTARTFSIAGESAKAEKEYRLFLADALVQLGNARANVGRIGEASTAFNEAVSLNPESETVALAYGSALFASGDFKAARVQAERAVQLAPRNSQSQYMLGRILFADGDYQEAKQHLESAASETDAQLNFQVGYTLALTYLKLKDVNRASLVFDEMQIGFGDNAQLHIYFGHAFLMTEYYDRAITEFKRALEKDPKVKEAHYWLGLAYLSRDEDKGWDENAAEDRAEIANNPDDFRPHYDLGNIALKLHRTEEAERELKRSAEIQPDNPDPLIALGELLIGQRRLPEAEAAMSKAIALTKDLSRAGYQVNRAYYVLGRIQVETGRRDEGVKNLTKAAELREKAQPTPANRDTTAAAAQQRLSDAQPMPTEESRSKLPPDQQKKLEAYFDHLRPAIADAYNNLGVAAGSHNDFAAAMTYFRKAGEWYPSLETLDRNLGMAAFHAGSYQDAILPLWHALQRDPNDDRVRAALGLSYFSVRNYQGTIETLRPVEKLVSTDPGAGSAYAMSLIKAGEYEKGMGLLKALANANPKIADLHANLGETYAEQGIYANAVEEYRKSLALNPAQPRIHSLLGFALLRDGKAEQAITELRPAAQANPADPATRYYLALALLQSSKKDEATSLLRQLIAENPKYADAYYQMGKLELEGGNTTQAISNLESAAVLSPKSDYIHYQLSLAYGRDSRTEDAQREMQIYQALKTERRGNHEQAQSN